MAPAPPIRRLQPPRTLIADDDAGILTALRLLLTNNGYELEAVSSPAALLEAIGRSQFDVVLMDLNYARDTTSGREGMDLISRVHALDPALPIVVMTGWATVDLAVEAMRRGVGDFVQKPWENSRLLQTLHKQVRHARARRNAQQRLSETRKTEAQFKRELIEARELQENLLANTTAEIEGLQVAVKWQPATTVGGDYIAAFNIDDEHAALCVADVVGKGLPATLLMSNFQAALKSLASDHLSPADVSMRLNDLLYANIPLHKFVTAFYLYTDGLTEAIDPSGEQFGEQRLMQLLRDHRDESAEDLKEIIFHAVGEFCGNAFRDDVALMAVGIE